MIKYSLIYALALLTLGWAVNRMLETTEVEVKEEYEAQVRDAWSNGFERGVRSVDVLRPVTES